MPEAHDWKDGEVYELTIKQVSHTDDGAVYEILEAGTEDEEESKEQPAEVPPASAPAPSV